GRTILFNTQAPIAMGFLGSLAGTGYSFYITAAFLLLGVFTKLSGASLIACVLSVGLLCCVNLFASAFLVKRRNLHFTTTAQSLATAVCSLIGGIGAGIATGFEWRVLLVAAVDSTLVYFLVFVLKKGAMVLTASKKKPILSNEEAISIALIFGCAIAGAADIHIGEISLRYFLAFYFILLAAQAGDAAVGVCAGLLTGLVLSAAGYWDPSAAVVLSVAGLGTGLMKGHGRGIVLASFAVCGAVCAWFAYPALLSLSAAFSFGASAICFMATPKKFSFHITAQINPVMENTQDYVGKIKNLAVERLDAFSDSFEKLAKTYKKLSERHAQPRDASAMVDAVAARACAGCPRKNKCWEERFYATYQTVLGMIGQIERSGQPEESETNGAFFAGCASPEKFVDDVVRICELEKVNRKWEQNTAEDRELASQQLDGVSGIIKGLSQELEVSLKFNEELEEKVLQALERNKIEVDRVIVLENKAGKYEVSINHKFYYDKKRWNRTVARAVSGALKRKMQVEELNRSQHFFTRFIEEKKLRVTCGVARAAQGRKGESGDSYSFMELKNGECLLALSDGMGTGRKAQEESSAAMDLLESFIEAGFDKNLAVKIINSVLVLKNGDESFATLDICSIDLHSGDAEFIKIGAAATFLLREGKVYVIRSTSLPIGMLMEVDMEVSRRRLQSKDVLLMVTDGLLDVPDERGEKEDWIGQALRACRYINPQDIADHILAEAQRLSCGYVRDDMTVLAARIWEK
ncbi:MAG: stage II sporulation protein E, partial [Clostridiales bacterium]|nr:stage II sporulation protein E [Clostridiales bacterium]